MTNVGWAHRLLRRRALHPLLDPLESTQILSELRLQSPAKLLAEATAWLDSLLEPYAELEAADRLRIVCAIDAAARASASEIELCYAGLRSAPSGRLQDWRVLVDYLDRLIAACESAIEAQSAPHDDITHDLLARTMRAATQRLCASWMRYREPERSGWAVLGRCYSLANAAKPGDARHACGDDSGSQHPAAALAAAVMLVAAEPHTLHPAETVLCARLALYCAGSFIYSNVHDARCRWAFDVGRSAPVRLDHQRAAQRALIYVRAGGALEWLRERLEALRADGALPVPVQEAGAFAPALARRAIEHLLHFWSEHPRSRCEPRTRVNTDIGVTLGVPALKRALARGHDGRSVMLVREDDEERDSAPHRDAVLFDFSAHGIGARIPLDNGSLKVHGVIGFRLDRSEKWSVAVVRRLRAKARDEIEVGAEIIGRTVSLVALAPHLEEDLAPLSDGVLAFRQLCILLPEDPRVNAGPSLLFQPGTHQPGELVTLSSPERVRCIRLGATMEMIDGWDRVAFEWVA